MPDPFANSKVVLLIIITILQPLQRGTREVPGTSLPPAACASGSCPTASRSESSLPAFVDGVVDFFVVTFFAGEVDFLSLFISLFGWRVRGGRG
jgi:hypothetical protein